ncbi:MAG: HAD family hydrolase [Acidimicrobiales bacterium]
MSRLSRPLDAVTFDFWNTLVAELPESGSDGLWVDRLASIGFETEEAAVAAAWAVSWAGFHQEWHRGAIPPSTRAMVATMAQELGIPEGSPEFEQLVRWTEAGLDPAMIQPAPGIGDALAVLDDAGLRLGIICDAGRTPGAALRGYLDHHGLLRHFDHWSFSDEVGAFKPSAEIFAHAATGLGSPEPSRIAHVGDLVRTDVAGSRAAGWVSVRYRGLNDDPDRQSLFDSGLAEADVVIDDHTELPVALGLV